MEANHVDLCDNCCRSNIRISNVSRRRLQRKGRKKYFNLKHGPEGVILCRMCEDYICGNGRMSAEVYWPAMVWKFIQHEGNHETTIELPIEKRWDIIPTSWQVQYWPMCSNSRTEGSGFRDVTEEYNELEKAIDNLEWKSLAVVMDKYLAYPTVRCPWGCSEFLHRCNKLPYEAFLRFKSNWCFDTYPTSDKWTNGVSPTFPDTAKILECPRFLCEPSIFMDDFEGPVILCCHHHSASSTEHYIHPAISPTGFLFTNCSNEYAQAVM